MNQTSILNEQKLIQKIIDHEGIIPYMYQDSKGYWTIGCGRLIDHRLMGGLSDEECRYLLKNDIASKRKELSSIPWYNIQDEVRRGVILELSFNMGVPRLLTFQKMISALKVFDYNKAADEMIDSKWAKDVGKTRVNDMVYRMRTGTYK